MTSENVRIFKNASGNYEAKLPIPGISRVYGCDEISLMNVLARVMGSPNSLKDGHQKYGIWYGEGLGLSIACKQGLESIIKLRNRILDN